MFATQGGRPCGPSTCSNRRREGRALSHARPQGAAGNYARWLDMTELPDTDDLYAPFSGHCRGAAAAGKIGGGEGFHPRALRLDGGHPRHGAGLCAAGGRLLMRRDAHHSAQSACILADVEPVRPAPGADMATATKEIPCDAVFVTRPPPSTGWWSRCRARTGARAGPGGPRHLVGPPGKRPARGADCAVESAHKTLKSAYTGGAWLHAQRAGDEPRLRRMLRIVCTSSPSFLILRSRWTTPAPSWTNMAAKRSRA